MMELDALLSRMALALGIGLLFGLERGWRTRDAEPGSRAAGIRTFAISGLLGGIIGALAGIAGGIASTSGGILLGIGLCDLCGRDRNIRARREQGEWHRSLRRA